ncbi:MAG: SMC-Scp complex subunit ScpB [Halochromatium sp.]|nr:SMC-Scp complex subunit ScpB [Halochromatium sp.]
MSDWEQDISVDEGLTDEAAAPDAVPRQHALSLLVPGLQQVVEGALLAAAEPLSIERIQGLYDDRERPSREAVLAALEALREGFDGHGVELVEVAGGWRVQVRASVAPWVGRLWQEKATRYSRALLETLALIAYRQPITRGEIEQIRGVAVSTPIIKTLTEREWVRVVGHREVPGRPALYATTRRFLDYFGLRSLNDLPPLAAIRDASFFEQALNEETDGADLAAVQASSGPVEDAVEDSLDAATERMPQALVTRPAGRPHLVLAISNDAALGLESRESEPGDQQDLHDAEPSTDTNQRTGDEPDEGR